MIRRGVDGLVVIQTRTIIHKDFERIADEGEDGCEARNDIPRGTPRCRDCERVAGETIDGCEAEGLAVGAAGTGPKKPLASRSNSR